MTSNLTRAKGTASASSLAGKSVLVIEDEPLIALDLHASLSAAGASVIAASSVEEAIDLLGYAEVSAAIVDVHLGSDEPGRICDLLWGRRIPFVFHTGDPDHPVTDLWPEAPVLGKPANGDVVVRALMSVMQAGT